MLLLANKWIIWSLIAGLNIGMFFILKLITHTTVWALSGPYLVTFVMPVPIFVQVAAWLGKWEKHRPPPKLMAFCWGLAMAILVAGVNSWLFYFGSKFHVFEPTIGDFIFVVGFLTLTAAIVGYSQVLQMVITRRANTGPS